MRLRPASLGVLTGLLLGGCTSTATRPQRFVLSFVPPAAPPAVPLQLPEAPPYSEGLLDREQPGFLLAALAAPPEPPEADRRIKQSEVLFQEGLRLHRAGEWDQARVEFDRALEVLLRAPANLTGRELIARRYHDLADAIHRIELEQASREHSEPVFDRAPLDDIIERTFPIDPRLAPRIREQVSATVSQLPLEVNDLVMSYITYFNTKGRRSLIGGLTRSGRYRAMIQRILDEEGLPPELIFLAQAESGFLPRAVSVKKATGMWQFISARGREYGLDQTREIDDRLDPEKATRAAARHLKDLYHQFGDWYLAVAAYNCGPLNVQRAVERTGYADFWEIRKRNALPRETSNYLPIILALTIITKNPREYGIEDVTPDPPIEYDTLETEAPTHLGLLADILGMPLANLKELNPAILRAVAPAGYQVRVPRGSLKIALAGLDLVPRERRSAWRVHRVGAGESLPVIARRYGVAERSIADLNADCMTAEEGDLLVIPAGYPEPAAAQKARGKARAYTSARARPAPARR
jgi:membrane-bound lytic murein transglycosylase D